MLHRNKKENDMHEGKWVGLGGKMEQGESPEECVIREVKEESGLDIINPELKIILTFPGFGEDDWYGFLFTADDFTGELVEDCPEGTLEWVDDAELLDLDMHEGDKIFLKLLDEKKVFSAKFVYKKNKLQDYTIREYPAAFS